jgi:hypothetical protein
MNRAGASIREVPFSQKIYTVSDPIAFHALSLPLPPHSLIFLCAANQAGAPSPPPGVLLIQGVHYLVSASESFTLGSQIELNVGDLVVVLTFT